MDRHYERSHFDGTPAARTDGAVPHESPPVLDLPLLSGPYSLGTAIGTSRRMIRVVRT
ncbi:hypothetical protein J2S55_007262 [Streptosporangium brasiliense]|uniref:Uncharacterized protein n=1 Tax=Streptosporangium brasiliense TaxID=47480 RepID=A0ABT9RGM1_9ACTN|nr:hypothetical protein [Streptosporangium brasiliense]